jgi:dynein heavy chain
MKLHLAAQEWIPDSVWLNVMALAQLDTFRDLPDSIVRSDSAWRAWYDHESPEAVPIPDFETRLTKFQRMCVVRCALAWKPCLFRVHSVQAKAR